MLTFEKGKDLAARARTPKGYRLASNTHVTYRAGLVWVRYQYTNIIVINRQNVFFLNTGGWHTMTTRNRFQEYAPVVMYRHRWNWVFDTTHGYKVSWPTSAHFCLGKGDWIRLLPPNMQ